MNTSYEDVAHLSSTEKRALLEKLLKEKARSPRLFPLSFSQQRLWFLDKLQPECAAYNLPTVVRLTGKINCGNFRKGLDLVIDRHEALRTVFVAKDDSPFQQVNPASPAEFHVLDVHPLRTGPGAFDHFRSHIYADDLSCFTDFLGGKEAIESCA